MCTVRQVLCKEDPTPKKRIASVSVAWLGQLYPPPKREGRRTRKEAPKGNRSLSNTRRRRVHWKELVREKKQKGAEFVFLSDGADESC